MRYRIRIEEENPKQEGTSYRWESVYEQTVENIDLNKLVTIINNRPETTERVHVI